MESHRASPVAGAIPVSALVGDPVIRPLTDLDGARDHASPAARLEDVRERAVRLRDRLLHDDPVRFYRSMDLIAGPYPTRYGLLNAGNRRRIGPFCMILNRMFVVRFDSDDGVKTLVVSPTHHRGGGVRATPYFARLAATMGPLRPVLQPALTRDVASVQEACAAIGLDPASVDYVTYDHLHVQDVRPWIGTRERPGYFPNAKLLVTPEEWASAHGLTPPQADWYCPGGLDGVDPSRLLLLDRDVRLGRGVALIRTPGHTEGNHSIVVRTPEGLMVTSENGIGPDNYAPERSRLPGVRRYARDSGVEVVLNGNTLERAVDQYISMVLEKTLAGPSARDPDFPNLVCSSEMTAHWAYPGARPSFSFGELCFGALDG